MTKQKHPANQTKCIDDCICPYCGHKFDGQNALNYDMSREWAFCPSCNKEMKVEVSIEYMCTTIDD